MKGEKIVQRYNALWSQRKTIDQTYQDIETYISPYRGEFFQDMNSEHEQRMRRTEHYDSTAIYSAKSLKSHIHGMLVSPATKWFGLTYRSDKLNDDQEASVWLEDTEDKVYQELVDSNFNIQTAEFMYDMVTYGMGFIIEEVEDEINWSGVDFKTVGVRESYFEQDHRSDLINYYRRIQWTPLQVYDRFGEDTPKDIIERAENPGSVDSKIEIIFCIYKRDEKDLTPFDEITTVENRPYGAKYVRHSTGQVIGDEKGYYEMPAFYAIWDSTSSSKFGNSPAMTCLSDVKNVNEFIRLQREQAGMAVLPPILTTSRNVVGDINFKSRGLTVVQNMDKIREWVTSARFDIGDNTLGDFRASIERAFLVDSLQLKESPAMTATEVQARYDLMMRNISHTLGSLQTNFLDKAVVRTMNILYRAGRLSKMPDIVKQSQDEMDINYTGPMPRAQKRDDVLSTRQWLQDTAVIAQIQIGAGLTPEVLDNVDFDTLERDLAKDAGVPARYTFSKEKVKEIRDKRGQAQAKAQRMAELEQAGQALQSAGAGAKAIDDNPDVMAALA